MTKKRINLLELKEVPSDLAGKILGKGVDFIRYGLQQKVLPFGVAVKTSSSYTYHISPFLLSQYIGKSEVEIEVSEDNEK